MGRSRTCCRAQLRATVKPGQYGVAHLSTEARPRYGSGVLGNKFRPVFENIVAYSNRATSPGCRCDSPVQHRRRSVLLGLANPSPRRNTMGAKALRFSIHRHRTSIPSRISFPPRSPSWRAFAFDVSSASPRDAFPDGHRLLGGTLRQNHIGRCVFLLPSAEGIGGAMEQGIDRRLPRDDGR